MKSILLLSLFLSMNTQAATVEYRAEYCQPETDDELEVYMEDMGWGQNLSEMKAKFNAIYDAGKRLNYRAFVSEDGFALPLKKSNKVVNISERFITSVTSHIETALESKHVDYIFFSDMGHSHLYIDKDLYENKIVKLEVKQKKERIELMLNHPKTKFLYHTAEQLEMLDEEKVLLDDRKLQWRFFTRNIMGDNLSSKRLEVIHAHDNTHNTASPKHYVHKDKYHYWSSGFALSASSNGCFAYKNKGETFYFDISLYDVTYENLGHTAFRDSRSR